MSDTTCLTAEQVAAWLPARTADSHKGSYGKVLLVCGSYGMAGAARLSTEAALRCGVGLAVLALPHTVYPVVASALPEAVYRPLPEADGCLPEDTADRLQEDMEKAGAMVIGCGLGRGKSVRPAVLSLLEHAHCPVVLDADGINAVGLHIVNRNANAPQLILTPHEQELARMMGVDAADIHADRTEFAQRAARQCNAVVVLKGHRTLIAAPDGSLLENATGNSGMATGGSGDALAGMIAALVAQGVPPYRAAACGVYLHGLAGDMAARRLSEYAMLPSDLIAAIGTAFQHLLKRD